MAQKKKKKCVSSKSHGNLANTKARKIEKKKSIVNTKKTYLSNQITIGNTENVSNGEEAAATQKFNLSRCQHKKKKKEKSVRPYQKAKLSNQIIISNFNQISNGEEEEEEATQKFNLSRCQHKKKNNKSVCKGKSIVEPSNDNTTETDQVIRIHFQEEIMTDILTRLPVSSLLRFKCVSKFWKSLIVDPYFKMAHSRNDQNSQKFLITEMCYGKDDMSHFYTCSLSMVQVVEHEQKLDWPSSSIPRLTLIYCSCDGLVLILVYAVRLYQELLLWNPSTRESILLPHPEFPVKNCVCGLVYDATSEDYKILSVNLNALECPNTWVEILSLKSGSWRRIDYPSGIQRVKGFRDCGMDYLPFLHGAFHWLVKTPSGYYTTISFNISNEVYGEVPLVERMYDGCRNYFFIDHGVSELRGMLCFYSTYSHATAGRDCTFKLWVMKDYGVGESWTKLIEIRDTDLFHSARPKYMFADGQVLLHCKHIRCLGSKFMTSREPFRLCSQYCVTFKEGIVYAESFISPKSLT